MLSSLRRTPSGATEPCQSLVMLHTKFNKLVNKPFLYQHINSNVKQIDHYIFFGPNILYFYDIINQTFVFTIQKVQLHRGDRNLGTTRQIEPCGRLQIPNSYGLSLVLPSPADTPYFYSSIWKALCPVRRRTCWWRLSFSSAVAL